MINRLEEFSKFLHEQFLEYERELGERASINDFARYLNIKPGALNHWMNGVRLPADDNVDILANRLGGQVYDLLGLARKDKVLSALLAVGGASSVLITWLRRRQWTRRRRLITFVAALVSVVLAMALLVVVSVVALTL